MAMTGAETEADQRPRPAAGWTGRRAGAWLRGRLRNDPVRLAALAIIAGHLVIRADIASAGFLVNDDFVLAASATERGLSTGYLFDLFHNHLMPGGLFVTWLVTDAYGLSYWPYVVLMIAAQALLGIAFYRLLRLVLPAAGWGLLVPLCLFLFCPLSLETTAWWAVAANQLPMQLAMVLALGAQVKYARTGRARHLVTLGAALALGLLFFEKALLIVPLVFLWTACLLVAGGPVRGTVEALRRFWRSWLVLAVVTLGYLTLYLARASTTVREPASTGEVVTFVRQIIGSTVVPGLFGGPWRWLDAGDGPPATAPTEPARWLSWALLAALVVVTARRRPVAIRAWVLLSLYVAIVMALLGATRLGLGYSGVAGLTPRYVSDVVVVAALCVGLALLGPAGAGPHGAGTHGAGTHGAGTPKMAGGVAAVLALALVASASWSAARFGDDWAVKQGRDYLRTVRAELAAAPVDTVFFDAPVPDAVISVLSRPYNMQSRLFQYLSPRPQFVTTAENPSIFDDAGRVRPVRVAPDTVSRPGPDTGCGYKVSGGRTVRIELAEPVRHTTWTVRLGYISGGDTPAVLYFGGTPARFEAKAGLNQIYFMMDGGGEALELTLSDPWVTMCAGDVTVGLARPQ